MDKMNNANQPAGSASGKKRSKRNDIILIVAVLVIALGAWVVLRGGLPTSQSASSESGATGPYAVVQNTEGFREVLPLSQDATVDVTSSLGENLVVVSGGKVSVEEADCKNQICVQTGKVNRVGDTIVCLPHQLVIQVVDKPEDASAVQGLLK
jgi:hypothetical protein